MPAPVKVLACVMDALLAEQERAGRGLAGARGLGLWEGEGEDTDEGEEDEAGGLHGWGGWVVACRGIAACLRLVVK